MAGIGERVTGVPVHKPTRRKHPTVTGYYDRSKWEFMGKEYVTEFVTVGNEAVDCEDIRPAERREKDTVF